MTLSSPYWIVLGDIHDQTEGIGRIPELKSAEGILVSGDLTMTGGVGQAGAVLEQLLLASPNVRAQVGNMDRPEVTGWLQEQNLNLHAEVHELTPDVAIMGLGASTFTPFGTPSEYPESWFAGHLEHMWHTARRYRHVILVSHNPPANTACDMIGDNQHVGSTVVREFIEEAQPALCLCGHIHESRGEDYIGLTKVINPGAFIMGGYALLYLDQEHGGVPDAKLCTLP